LHIHTLCVCTVYTLQGKNKTNGIRDTGVHSFTNSIRRGLPAPTCPLLPFPSLVHLSPPPLSFPIPPVPYVPFPSLFHLSTISPFSPFLPYSTCLLYPLLPFPSLFYLSPTVYPFSPFLPYSTCPLYPLIFPPPHTVPSPPLVPCSTVPSYLLSFLPPKFPFITFHSLLHLSTPPLLCPPPSVPT
jgi:hypothetical protein